MRHSTWCPFRFLPPHASRPRRTRSRCHYETGSGWCRCGAASLAGVRQRQRASNTPSRVPAKHLSARPHTPGGLAEPCTGHAACGRRRRGARARGGRGAAAYRTTRRQKHRGPPLRAPGRRLHAHRQVQDAARCARRTLLLRGAANRRGACERRHHQAGVPGGNRRQAAACLARDGGCGSAAASCFTPLAGVAQSRGRRANPQPTPSS